LRFEDDCDGADDEAGLPREASEWNPSELTAGVDDHAADEVPGGAPEPPQQVEAGVPQSQAADALNHQCGDFRVDDLGAAGVHDLLRQEHVSASECGDSGPVGNDPDADGVGVDQLGNDPPGDRQPCDLGGCGASGAMKDPDKLGFAETRG